jgi:hypothetical protein
MITRELPPDQIANQPRRQPFLVGEKYTVGFQAASKPFFVDLEFLFFFPCQHGKHFDGLGPTIVVH